MTKAKLVEIVAQKAMISKKDADAAIKAFQDTVGETLKKGEKIQLVGFGTFETLNRAPRKGKNPQTGKEILIPGAKVPKFKPGVTLKDIVNG